jgi:diguanylate cyclase (GGDEF)-like protein
MMMMSHLDYTTDSTQVNRQKKVMYSIVDLIMSACAITLMLRFDLLIMDPSLTSITQQDPTVIYETLRGPIDAVYSISSVLQAPVDATVNVIGEVTGLFPNATFPTTPSSAFGEWLQPILNRLPQFARQGIPLYMFDQPANTWMPGRFEWNALIAIALYMAARPMITESYYALRNGVMNAITERKYVDSQKTKFEEAIANKNREIEVATNKSKNLQHEVSTLETSIVLDELTQAYNRRFFSEQIRELFNTNKSKRRLMTVMMVDIDHFKQVNDTYGHLVGDEVLKLVADVLKKFTPKDGYCCRYGGEEFAILLPILSLEQANSSAEIIRNEVMRLQFPSAPKLNASVSIGIANADFGSLGAQRTLHHYEDLIKHADDALYKAKTTGRNKVISTRIH